MHFASFSDFMAMGGYAFYVWLSFGLTLVCLVGIIISTRMKTRSLLAELRSKQARGARRKAAQQMENTL
ncbi:TPA: heme exporter protein CcmD [Aeromonas veronii]